jgi:hypothetical protein
MKKLVLACWRESERRRDWIRLIFDVASEELTEQRERRSRIAHEHIPQRL